MNRRFKMYAINYKESIPRKEIFSLQTSRKDYDDYEIKSYLAYIISTQIESKVNMLADDMMMEIVQNIYGGHNKNE
ncbi:MAG: hypothetical protein ACI4JM_10645 [Oscillospiraceae bacterium]